MFPFRRKEVKICGKKYVTGVDWLKSVFSCLGKANEARTGCKAALDRGGERLEIGNAVGRDGGYEHWHTRGTLLHP